MRALQHAVLKVGIESQNFVLHAFSVRDVAHHTDNCPVIFIAVGLPEYLDFYSCAIFAAQRRLEQPETVVPVDKRPIGFVQLRNRKRACLAGAQLKQLFTRVAEHFAGGRIDFGVAQCLRIDQKNGIPCGVHGRAEALQVFCARAYLGSQLPVQQGLLFFAFFAFGVVNSNQQITNDVVVAPTQRCDRHNSRNPAAVLANKG